MVYCKRRVSLALSAILIVISMLAGCAGGVENAPQKAPPAEDIAQAIITSCSFDEMIKIEDSVLYNQYGDLDESILVDSAVYTSTLVLADEVCVLRVKNEEDIKAVLAAIDTRLGELTDKFTGYREEELPKVKNALIETRGTYILMTTTPDGEVAAKEFKAMLE